MHVIAVILAAGSGARLGAGAPKQLLTVAGRTVLEHSVAAFASLDEVDEVMVVTREDLVDRVSGLMAAASLAKVTAVLAGGATRNDSTRAALAAIDADEQSALLIHDAVRPLVDAATIRRCLAALAGYDAVSTAIDSADTIVEVDGAVIRSMPPRSVLRRLQTPQGFRLGTLRAAYSKAGGDGDPATDDCGVVARHLPDVPIAVVEGSVENLKITHPDDVAVAERLLAARRAGAPDRHT
jgi:2-C-methyl-D-erythritol 4-phosphate cytidylyltransferase